MFRKAILVLATMLIISSAGLAQRLIDLTVPGTTLAVPDTTPGGYWISPDGAWFVQGGARTSGTGVFDPFVRLGAKETEQGYNTDYRPVQFDEFTAANFTHALLYTAVPIVTYEGVPCREFKLNINERAEAEGRFISLDQLKIYETSLPNLHGYDPLSVSWPNASKIFDLDEFADNYIKLDATLGPGIGTGDMSVYVPESKFTHSVPYLTLYSRFGDKISSDAGPELWGVTTPSTPEPCAILSMMAGLGGIVGLALRKRR